MSARCDTYSLLVARLGEQAAYKLCEELGGTRIDIPLKAHKTHKIKSLAIKALPLFEEDEKKKARFVKIFTVTFSVSRETVYKIIQKVEDEKRNEK